jgi:plastocyanin
MRLSPPLARPQTASGGVAAFKGHFMPLIRAFSLATLIAAAAVPALAQDAATVRLTIRNHRFEPAEARVPAGKPITLHVKNADATAEEFESKALRVETVIAGNGEVTIPLRPLKPGRYRFFGEYHEATAQGALVAE